MSTADNLTLTDAAAVAELRAVLTKAPTVYNRRYLAYATAHGRAPEAMLAHDEQAWPGGKMTGFMLWISEQWQAWANRRGIRNVMDYIKSDEDHADFDRFIGAPMREEPAK